MRSIEVLNGLKFKTPDRTVQVTHLWHSRCIKITISGGVSLVIFAHGMAVEVLKASYAVCSTYTGDDEIDTLTSTPSPKKGWLWELCLRSEDSFRAMLHADSLVIENSSINTTAVGAADKSTSDPGDITCEVLPDTREPVSYRYGCNAVLMRAFCSKSSKSCTRCRFVCVIDSL